MSEGGGCEAAYAAERDEARLQVQALKGKVAEQEAKLAVARKEVATAKDDAGYFQLVGQVHEKVRISAEKLVGKLSGEKQLLEREMERLLVGRVLKGRDKRT